MPATSQAQQRMMGFLKSHPGERKRRGIPADVVEKFATTGGKKLRDLPKHKLKKRTLKQIKGGK
jgi:hypothetical protein